MKYRPDLICPIHRLCLYDDGHTKLKMTFPVAKALKFSRGLSNEHTTMPHFHCPVRQHLVGVRVSEARDVCA